MTIPWRILKFTISVTDVDRAESGKVLPRHFNVSYWDAASGKLLSNKDYQVRWARFGKYDLPVRRLLVATSEGKRTVYELLLSDHRLVEKTAAGK